MKKTNIAIVCATGNVGREILKILYERKFPFKKISIIASKKSEGTEIKFGPKKILKIQSLENFDFSNIDLVLSSPGAKISKTFVPLATKSGAVVIDNTSCFRMDDDVPLIVPEVNLETMKLYRSRNVIANPNCSTIQMVVALKPLHDEFKIKKIVVSTYQSTSGAGKSAMDELFDQTISMFKNKTYSNKNFTKKIAFNVIPHIDKFLRNGDTKEESKMVNETKKILGDEIEVFATCVRVPVFIGHGESVYIETDKKISASLASKVLKTAPGIKVIDTRKDGGYVTPDETFGEDDVFVSRIRESKSIKNSLGMWVVADNLRKGAALNSVQIAENLIRKYL
ncbi:MAG: aspartate-semialdehyde dehydrogenase [Rickettsiales bacterium]|nr:aspartate-semialdehyde dehydrogenase [Rickettsiales bacterium]OUV54576.1 MAG: aspartate-semialdehyde dehydrogenase [Rickettsiales bacterium TMED127]